MKKRLAHINARLDDDFTEQQIIDAMTYVATDSWHINNGQNLIEIAVRSTEQLEKKLIKIASLKSKPTATKIDRTTDPLAVNNGWAGANKSNIVEPNMTIEEMMGSW